MRFKSDLFKIAIFPLLFVLISCVKDVDVNQYEEVIFTPEAAIDLIYFTITSKNFSAGANGNLTAADSTRLDFLDDNYIQDGLLRADFNYRFTNSFSQELIAQIRFLSESGAVQHEVTIPISAGSPASPVIVDYTEIINKDQIHKIKRSIEMSIEITMQDGSAVEGELQMKSKAYYYFEF